MNIEELKQDIVNLKKSVDNTARKLVEDRDKLRRWNQALDLLEGRPAKKKQVAVKKVEPKTLGV